MSYEVKFSKQFKKSLKKLAEKDKPTLDEIINRLALGEVLEPKYKDHKLQGKYDGFRECHIRPDLLLIYKKINERLILYCFNIASHSEAF